MRIILLIVTIGWLAWGCDKNHGPVISGITCSPESRSAGTVFTIRAIASDEDGDVIQYLWSVDGGAFTDSITRNQTVWKSPVDGNGKIFTLRVTVSDGEMESYLDYQILLTEPVFGSLSGYTYFSNCKVIVSGATIRVDDQTAVSDSSGYFNLNDVAVGAHTLLATKHDFGPVTLPVTINKSVNLKVTVSMTSVLYSSKVFGIVKGQDSLPVSGAKVTLLNPDDTESNITSISNSSGYYLLWYVPVGKRKITAQKSQTSEFGFDEKTLELDITGPEYPLDIELNKYGLIGKITDPRDGHMYGYKIYGTQTWMTENLAYLPSVSPSTAGNDLNKYYYIYGYEGANVTEARATENFTIYGVLYNWNAAMADCPVGWHLPSETEWDKLENYLGPEAGYAMKSTAYWSNHGNGNNASGFNALPAGGRRESGGFSGLGNGTKFWTSTQRQNYCWIRSLTDQQRDIWGGGVKIRQGNSVRCMKNQ